MTGGEFTRLLALLGQSPRESRSDVIGRLKAGGAAKRLRFFGKKKRP